MYQFNEMLNAGEIQEKSGFMNDLTSTFKTVLLWAAAAVAVPVIVLIVVNLMPKKGKNK